MTPIAPLVKVSSNCKKQVIDLLDSGILSNWYGGAVSHDFEKKFAAFYGMQYGLAVNSGTSALHVAFATMGIGPGTR